MKSKILIVEDESITAMSFEQSLKSLDYDVVGVASTGKEAISKVADLGPNLVLMDIVLKGEMDGIEAAAKIKEEFDVPIVYLTAHPEESAINRAKHTSPYGYLIKPVSPIDLKNTIELAVYKHQIENKLKESEAKYRTLFDNPLDMITLSEAPEKSSQRNFIEVNRIATERLGYSRDELLNMTPTDIVAPEKRSQIPQITKNLIKYGYDKFESIHLSKDGKKIPVEVYNHKFELNGKNVVLAVSRDITERKEADVALHEREEFLSGTLNDMSTFVAILKLDGEIIFVNNTPLKLIEKNLEDVKGMMFYDVEWWTFSEETINKLKEHIKLCASGEAVEYETQIQTLHGLTWIDYSMHPVFDEKKKVKYLVAEGRNITQHKKSEKKLETSEKRYQSIFENSGTGLLTFEKDGTIIMMNSEWERLSGYSHEELEGKRNWMEFVHPDYLEKMMEYHQQREKDPESVPLQYETVFIIKNGEQLFTYITVTPIPDTDKWLVSALDITDLKNTQKKLEKSVLRSRALTEYAVDGIITTDAHGKILYFNNSLLNMFGYTKEELINSQLTQLMPERYRENFMDGLRKFRSTGEHRLAGRIIETIGLKKDDNEFPFEMSLTKWEADKKIYFTSIIRNISERKKSENEIKKSLKEKEMLLKEIHHRVKNNLQIISSLLDLQESYVKEDAKAINVLQGSQNRVISMAIIHEMLYQSKDLGKIDFSEYIRNLTSHLFSSLSATSITSIVNVENICLNIETAVPCGLIISELVSNSLKYAYPNDAAGELLISFKPLNNELELIISDNGVGFPVDLDFKHIKSSLGLQLVISLVNQLDGTIELDRSQGTKFTINFNELKYKERI